MRHPQLSDVGKRLPCNLIPAPSGSVRRARFPPVRPGPVPARLQPEGDGLPSARFLPSWPDPGAVPALPSWVRVCCRSGRTGAAMCSRMRAGFDYLPVCRPCPVEGQRWQRMPSWCGSPDQASRKRHGKAHCRPVLARCYPCTGCTAGGHAGPLWASYAHVVSSGGAEQISRR